jgi:hypothetical protein
LDESLDTAVLRTSPTNGNMFVFREKMLIRWNSVVELLRESVAKTEGPCDLSGKVKFSAFREAA